METRTYTNRSNARRAAREAGVNPDLVYQDGDEFAFPSPPEKTNGTSLAPPLDAEPIPDFLKAKPRTPEQQAALDARIQRNKPQERKLVMRDTPVKKSAKLKTAKSGDKTALLRSMLKTGATVAQLTKATDWLPHTLRARISGLQKPKNKGGEGLTIERTRTDGVTSYKIAS